MKPFAPAPKAPLILLGVALIMQPISASAETCTVEHCHDGDTCTLICSGEKTKVRLHCIDAPEIQQGDWGKKSRDVLKTRLIPRSTVELQEKTKDRYGRTVGVIHQGGVNINLQMVHSGWAATYPKYCAEPVYYQAQDDAQATMRGIWQQPGTHQQPWEWRTQQR